MDSVELYYQVAQSHLLEQDQRNRDLELKATGTSGVGIALVGLAALVMADFSGVSANKLSALTFVLAGALGVTFLVAFYYSLRTLWVRDDWDRRPMPRELAGHLSNYPEKELVEWVADGITCAHEINERVLITKANAVKRAMLALSSETVFLALLAISTRL